MDSHPDILVGRTTGDLLVGNQGPGRCWNPIGTPRSLSLPQRLNDVSVSESRAPEQNKPRARGATRSARAGRTHDPPPTRVIAVHTRIAVTRGHCVQRAENNGGITEGLAAGRTEFTSQTAAAKSGERAKNTPAWSRPEEGGCAAEGLITHTKLTWTRALRFLAPLGGWQICRADALGDKLGGSPSASTASGARLRRHGPAPRGTARARARLSAYVTGGHAGAPARGTSDRKTTLVCLRRLRKEKEKKKEERRPQRDELSAQLSANNNTPPLLRGAILPAPARRRRTDRRTDRPLSPPCRSLLHL
ncbi:uncharacterized protein LOC144578535 [Callithrix jacchus]